MTPNEPARQLLLRRNLILTEGVIAAPLAAYAVSVSNALLLCLVFSIVTGVTVLLSALIPQRMPAAFRILSYSLIAALVYIPAALAADFFAAGAANGLYLPLLSTGLLLTAEHDRFFAVKRLAVLLARLIAALLGVCLVTLLFGGVRELLGAGTLGGRVYLLNPPLPVLLHPAAGIILLACVCIVTQPLCRKPEQEVSAHAADH